MKNNFKYNKLFTIGIEEEYMLCNPITGDLTNKAHKVMNNLDDQYIDRYSYELLLSEIESNTSVCNDVNQCINEIVNLRNNLKEIGKRYNFKIGMSGTHPTANPYEQKFINNDSYEWVRNQLKYYASQNITFSTHVHIGMNDPELTIKTANIARCWIAPLLAITTNSPFFNGELTGMHSSRTFQFGLFPRTNIPHELKNMDEYNKIIDNYIKSESISKPRQIWWKIRPHLGFGTLEFRIFDVQRSLENTKMIAAICQALVHKICSDLKENKTFNTYNLEYLNDGLWKAASKGLDSLIINPINEKPITMKNMINSMLDYIYPSLVYFNTSEIQNTVEKILQGNTESNNQIKIFNDSGIEGLKKYLITNVEYKII